MDYPKYRDFRPAFHFTPPSMWMNDPNGMFFDGETYHYFYQYDPSCLTNKAVGWGHATSKDLIHWEHLPLAIAPDELGLIFSGSSVYDINNTSGFGAFGQSPIVSIYTSHGESEKQCIAYSIDGVNFEKYEGNPVIPNPGIRDFRDPKAFWNRKKNRWGLVLAAGDRVHFYASDNLKKWWKTGEFGPEGNKTYGVWECPDLFPVETEEGEKWVLIVSMGNPERRKEKGDTQYFIGDFDGDTFTNTIPFDETEYIDFGRDNYAGVTFQNAKDVIMMSWADNWAYASAAPSYNYKGQATLARKLGLVKTPCGYRLSTAPQGIGKYLGEPVRIHNDFDPGTQTFALRLKGNGPSRIVFSNCRGQELVFGIGENNTVYLDRSHAGKNDFSEEYNRDYFAKIASKRYFEGGYQMEVLFDVSVMEIFLDKGTKAGTFTVYPETPYNKITVSGAEASFYPIETGR